MLPIHFMPYIKYFPCSIYFVTLLQFNNRYQRGNICTFFSLQFWFSMPLALLHLPTVLGQFCFSIPLALLIFPTVLGQFSFSMPLALLQLPTVLGQFCFSMTLALLHLPTVLSQFCFSMPLALLSFPTVLGQFWFSMPLALLPFPTVLGQFWFSMPLALLHPSYVHYLTSSFPASTYFLLSRHAIRVSASLFAAERGDWQTTDYFPLEAMYIRTQRLIEQKLLNCTNWRSQIFKTL
jgi:hypothetical protein